MTVEDISSSLEDLGFNDINVRPLEQDTIDNPMWNPSLYSYSILFYSYSS
jgi:hypothetical protein